MPGAWCDLCCSHLAAEGTGGGSLMQQPSCSALRLLQHLPDPSFCPLGCLMSSPLPSCLVAACHRGCNSSKSTVQNCPRGWEGAICCQWAQAGIWLWFSQVDTLSLLPVLALFPHVLKHMPWGRHHANSSPPYFTKLTCGFFSTQFLLIFQTNFAFPVRITL